MKRGNAKAIESRGGSRLGHRRHHTEGNKQCTKVHDGPQEDTMHYRFVEALPILPLTPEPRAFLRRNVVMNRSFAVVMCLTGTLLCAIPAGAQGVQTAVLTGATTSADGVALPGVTVSASSPTLLGDRTDVTDVNGVYSIKGLPAGTYAVTFDLDNFRPARRENRS